MESVYSKLAAVGLALFVCAPSHAATTDPEIIIYRVTGVNFGGAATNFVCTPFSGATETVRFVIRDTAGNQTSNAPFAVNHLGTVFTSTASGGSVGTAAIAATSNQVICQVTSGGIALRMIRFNPISGAQE